MSERTENDSIGSVKVPNDKLWGAQTQRSLCYFDIGDDLFPSEMIRAYAIVKKACATVNHAKGVLGEKEAFLIVQVCDELLEGLLREHFPLKIWMTGSGTQFNMNVNEVIANRACQLKGQPLGSKAFIHPNDHVNLSQSTNDNFPTAMSIAAAVGVHQGVLKELKQLAESFYKKSQEWREIIKIGRTHLQDATPLTFGQEFSGYAQLIQEDLCFIEHSLQGVYELAIGGTAVGTGLNAPIGFDSAAAQQIARLTGLPFTAAPNKFAVQGSHNALVGLSAALKRAAGTLFKIANDIRFLSCGPRCGISEIILPSNEPGSSIMPGKVNPTQCEALSMVALQVIANDLAVTLGGSAGHLEMNSYKPLIMYNVIKSVRLLTDSCRSFRLFLVDGMIPNRSQIDRYLSRSLMLVTALNPLIGYDKSADIAHFAIENDLSLKEAAVELGYVTQEQFDQWVNPKKMI